MPPGNPLAARGDALISAADDVIAACREAQSDAFPETPDVAVVTLHDDGYPSIRIVSDWEKRIPATGLGDAVNRAVGEYYAAEAPAPDSDLLEQAWHPDASGRHLTTAMQRLNDAMDVAVARLTHAIAQLDAEPAPSATNRTGRIKVYANTGQLQSIHIDPGWAKGKSGAAISMELDEALRTTALAEPATSLDPLAADPRALLSYLKEML